MHNGKSQSSPFSAHSGQQTKPCNSIVVATYSSSFVVLFLLSRLGRWGFLPLYLFMLVVCVPPRRRRRRNIVLFHHFSHLLLPFLHFPKDEKEEHELLWIRIFVRISEHTHNLFLDMPSVPRRHDVIWCDVRIKPKLIFQPAIFTSIHEKRDGCSRVFFYIFDVPLMIKFTRTPHTFHILHTFAFSSSPRIRAHILEVKIVI